MRTNLNQTNFGSVVAYKAATPAQQAKIRTDIQGIVAGTSLKIDTNPTMVQYEDIFKTNKGEKLLVLGDGGETTHLTKKVQQYLSDNKISHVIDNIDNLVSKPIKEIQNVAKTMFAKL